MSFSKILHHLFVPHHKNNHRAKILHHTSLLILLLTFVSLTSFSAVVQKKAPEILGIQYSISEQDLLQFTNQARQTNGLSGLEYNEALADAARRKAAHMFSNNYWAHFAPDGTSPWFFINSAGYEYLYAGENLAKGFTDSPTIVNAWLDSPTHRENVLSDKYTQIGFAVVEGNLLGEETVLVVQMFGSEKEPIQLAAQQVPQTQGESAQDIQVANDLPAEQIVEKPIVEEEPIPVVTRAPEPPKEIVTARPQFASVQASPLFNIDAFSKTSTLILLAVILFALTIDFAVVKKKRIPRLVGNNIDHIMLIGMFIIFIIVQTRGGIL